MKLQAFYFSCLTMLTFGLYSCSEDEIQYNNITQPTAEDFPSVKKVTQTTNFGSMGSEIWISEFFYNEDGQLDAAETVAQGINYRSEYHYEGNKVSTVNYFENGTADGTTVFNYNGDALIYTLSGSNPDAMERTIYTYANGQVSTTKSFYPDGPNAELLQSKTYTYANGNVQQEIREDYFFGTSKTRIDYTYGSGNNPLRGMNPYLRQTMSTEGFDGLSINNPLTKQSTNILTDVITGQYHYEFTYNSDNFPTRIERIDSQSGYVISKTDIEYQ